MIHNGTCPYESEDRCERCSYWCEDGRPVMWPMPDLARFTVVIGDEGVSFVKKRRSSA